MEYCNRSNKIGPTILPSFSVGLTLIFFFGLPFILFFWMIPFVSKVTLGQDYGVFHMQHQLELFFSLKMGSFPLYVPGFAGGQSASALTLGQLFHPIALFSSIMPGYWAGKSLEWNTFYKLLSLGMAHFFFFRLLLKLRLDTILALIFSTIAIYNLRMLDLFRYASSLESWTGLFFLCTAIGTFFINTRSRWSHLGIVTSTYWVVCSGHPQAVYFSMLTVILYIVLFPYYLNCLAPEYFKSFGVIVKLWTRIGGWCLLGVCMTAAYILPLYFDFVVQSGGRTQMEYTWADNYRDTFFGTLNNLFQPLLSDVHGAWGGSPLFLAGILIPVIALIGGRLPRVIWVIWGLLCLVFLYMQGQRTPIHYLAWKYIPFADSFRVAGRISQVIPIFLVLLLIWLSKCSVSSGLKSKFFNKTAPVTAVTMMTILVTIGFYCLPQSLRNDTTNFSAISIRTIPDGLEMFLFATGIGILFLFVSYFSWFRNNRLIGIVMFIMTCCQLLFCFYYGTWIKPKEATKTFEQMLTEKKDKLDYAYSPGLGLFSRTVMKQGRESFLEPFLGKIYLSWKIVDTLGEAYSLMAQGRSPDEIILVDNISLTTHHVERDHQVMLNSGFSNDPPRLKLVYNTFNKLIFECYTPLDGFFGLSYPNDGCWHARVNGVSSPILMGNGLAHAVSIPPGLSQVEFYYRSPSMTVGTLISLGSVFLYLIMVSYHYPRRAVTMLLITGGFISLIGLTLFWQHSSYQGQNLGTEYSLTFQSQKTPTNLAYGRVTTFDQTLMSKYPLLFSHGQAVDGDKTALSSFITPPSRNPQLIIDFFTPTAFDLIKIYESQIAGQVNVRPLLILVSDDRSSWDCIGIIEGKYVKRPLIIQFPETIQAHYLAIQASGLSHLALDEVEVFALPGLKPAIP